MIGKLLVICYIHVPENLYPKFPSAPLISQESFNIETIRKYPQDITDFKKKYHGKQRKYKNAYNKLLYSSTGASSCGVISGISTITPLWHSRPQALRPGFFGLSPPDFGKSPWKLNRVKIAPKNLFRPKVKIDKTFALANIF